MWLLRVLLIIELTVLAGRSPAAAQEVPPRAPACWFTDQVLAPRPDWYRPDLSAGRVRQVTRTFQGEHSQVLGNRHQAAQSRQPAREILTYDAQGYLLRYQYALLPTKPGGSTQVLGNQFSYDARHRLRHIQVSGSKALLTVEDLFSSKAYARWRKPDPLFRARHRLPAHHEFMEIFPDTWQLHDISCRYDTAGRALLPQATVTLTSHTFSVPERRVVWEDTVVLDPRRDWHLATPDTLTGYADAAWLRQSDLWWQLRVPTTAAGLRLQHLPHSSSSFVRPGSDTYYAGYYRAEADYGFTGFFSSTGQLQLARMPGAGTVWRYAHDAQGQLQRVEAYYMHLPHRYGDTLYFGGTHPVVPIPDCEHRQREALTLPDGRQAVRELLWAEEIRYELNTQMLPIRAVVRTTTPHYAVTVSFNTSLSYIKAYSHNGPYVKVHNWRHIKALKAQSRKYQARGCVPMKLTTADTQVVRFSYTFF